MNQPNPPPSFHALDVALELIRVLRPLVGRIASHDAALARQMRASASSVALNVAEGSRRQGRDRTYHFAVAAGSAEETRAALLVAQAWGYLELAPISPALALLDRELAMLFRLQGRGPR